MDAILELAEFIRRTTFSDIPGRVLEHDKLIIMDTLGVGLAGSSAPGVAELAQWAKEMGGPARSTMLVFGEKVHPMYAGMVNATMFQALDFDDTNDDAFLHSHCTCLSTALAVAESLGGCSGEKLLEAVILGAEVMGRIGRSCTGLARFTHTGTMAYFGATAVAGKLLGLSVEELVDTFGIMYAQVSTTLQSNIDGALVKRMHPAFGVRGALTACMLVKKGFTGAKNVLEGRYGYMNLYESGQYDRKAMLDGLGSDWDVMNIGIKPFPCARDCAGALECGIALREQGKADLERIRSIHIDMPEITWSVAGKPYAEISGNIVVESILSSAWCGALGLCRGTARLEDFTPEGTRDAAVAAVAAKTTMSVDRSAPPMDMTPVTMTITYVDGTTASHTCRRLTGMPDTLPDMESMQRKFRDCAEHARMPFGRERQDRIIDMALNLEQCPDVGRLVELMCAEKR